MTLHLILIRGTFKPSSHGDYMSYLNHLHGALLTRLRQYLDKNILFIFCQGIKYYKTEIYIPALPALNFPSSQAIKFSDIVCVQDFELLLLWRCQVENI